MTVPAWLIAVVRTIIQAVVATALSATWVISFLGWLEESIGLSLSAQQIETGAFGLALAGVVALVNYLGKLEMFQWLNRLFSLFLSDTPAVYGKTELAGGEGKAADEVVVDMGGEDVPSTEKGAADVNTLLVVAAGIFAAISLFTPGPWLAIGVLCLVAAHLV
jgi:hypothetical protein